MDVITTASMFTGAEQAVCAEVERAAASPAIDHGKARRVLGEFVGNAFYGVLMRQMQASSLNNNVMKGGRAEEVFQSQLGMELAQRMGRALKDPLVNRLHRSMEKHLGVRDRQAGPDGEAAA